MWEVWVDVDGLKARRQLTFLPSFSPSFFERRTSAWEILYRVRPVPTLPPFFTLAAQHHPLMLGSHLVRLASSSTKLAPPSFPFGPYPLGGRAEQPPVRSALSTRSRTCTPHAASPLTFVRPAKPAWLASSLPPTSSPPLPAPSSLEPSLSCTWSPTANLLISLLNIALSAVSPPSSRLRLLSSSPPQQTVASEGPLFK